MRILVVEDDRDYREVELRQLRALGDVEIEVAESRDAALGLLQDQSRFWDVAILDLKIPTADGQLDADIRHGMSIVQSLSAEDWGMPVLVLSGQMGQRELLEFCERTQQLSAFGAEPIPMVRPCDKNSLLKCIEFVRGYHTQVEALSSIEVVPTNGGSPPARAEARLLRLIARRHGCRVVHVDRLKGLSGASVFRASFRAPPQELLHAAVRVAPLGEIRSEHEAFTRHVASFLHGRSYAPCVETTLCGAGRSGAIVYRFATDCTPMLDLIRTVPSRGKPLVDALRKNLDPWWKSRSYEQKTVLDIRRSLISDADIPEYGGEPSKAARARMESKTVQVDWCCSHGDLHPQNILVEGSGDPVLIDFGRTGTSAAALDPVTLELSLVFHPDARGMCPGWPTVAHARNWANVDRFTEGCPHAGYIKACRDWSRSVALGPREILATAYGFAMRQLKYDASVRELALAVAQSALDAFEAAV